MRIVFAILLVTVSVFAQDGQKDAGTKGPNPFQNPTNLKLLQPGNLEETMNSFRVALGVQCTFCHNPGNFASDEKPNKVTARRMIGMARQINGTFPDGKQHVRCYTCHRGAETPLVEPPKTN